MVRRRDHFLVVDDDAHIEALFVCEVLDLEGYQVRSAATARRPWKSSARTLI